jgi:hypothetical protein
MGGVFGGGGGGAPPPPPAKAPEPAKISEEQARRNLRDEQLRRSGRAATMLSGMTGGETGGPRTGTKRLLGE